MIPRPQHLFLCLLVAGILAGAGHAAYMNSTDYAMDSIFTSGGGVIDSTSADYRMDTAAGIITGYSNSTNYSTWLGLYGAPSTNIAIFTISISILYPANNSGFGPNQCWLLTTVGMTVTGTALTPSATCWLWQYNGTTWNLNQTLSRLGNGSVNFTIADSGLYGVNCTGTVGTATGTTAGLTQFTIIGASFCTAPATGTPDATGILVDMMILMAFLWFGGYLEELWMAVMGVFMILGIVTYAGINSGVTLIPNMNNIFIFFFTVYALVLLFATLFVIINIVMTSRDLINKRGKNG